MGLWYESHGPIPTTHFLLFGKFSAYDAWKKKLVLEFPKYGLKYDIEWENKKNHSSANIKVNGKKIKGEQITVVLPAEK